MKLLLIFFSCFTPLILTAQLKPQYTQYVLNNFLLNPAVSGIENYIDLKAGYRNQWTGLQGAPVTSYLSVNAPLGKEFIEGDANAFTSRGNNDPAKESYLRNYRAAAPHHGIGISVESDKAGQITQTDLKLSYAYHIGLSPDLNLAMGFSAGIKNSTLNKSDITLGVSVDPAITRATDNLWTPEIGMGLWLYSSDYFLGASAQQLMNTKNVIPGYTVFINAGSASRDYSFTGGLKFFLSDDLSLMPSVLIKIVRPNPVTYDLNFKLMYTDRIWAGFSYRHKDSYAAMLGININSLFNIGYSYEIPLSSINRVSAGSHEIVLGLLLNNRYHLSCPQRSF